MIVKGGLIKTVCENLNLLSRSLLCWSLIVTQKMSLSNGGKVKLGRKGIINQPSFFIYILRKDDFNKILVGN